MIKNFYQQLFFAGLLLLTASVANARGKKKPRVIVAYLTSWSKEMPDPTVVTHVNYAFGHVNATFDGVTIANPQRLQSVIGLKQQFPHLKVMLSIGGWGSGGFSEMAGNDTTRRAFAEDCARVIASYRLDGIDIDWEFPTSSMAKIASSPADTDNFTLLMAAIRAAIGKKKLLTLASVAGARYINFAAVNPYIDFVNIMAYDMSGASNHHAGLFRSPLSAGITADEAVAAHLKAGMPSLKLVLGIPFYGHGKSGVAGYINYKDIVKLTGYQQQWDDTAKAPYLTDSAGNFVCTFETPQSIAAKCDYIKSNHLLGAMYWDYAGDTEEGILRNAVFNGVFNASKF